ncbi:MAG: TRAP transporter substrate-binding protein DctP [Cypionkella sp.]|nr:TRAP transporter substrate-binding protein DctP [Cypionkella sp.]
MIPFTKLTAVRGASAALMMMSLISTGAEAAETLTITLDTPPTHQRTAMVKRFADLLVERSGGALTYELFDSGQLYNDRDAGRAVARGDADMSVLTTAALSRVEASLNVLDLPLLYGMTSDQRAAMVDGALGQRLSQAVGDSLEVVVPGNWFVLGRVFYWTTAKPLASFEDFTGLQIRIPGGAANVERLASLGGNAVVMPFADTPLALQQGVVDGTMGSIETMVSQHMVDNGIRHGFWDQGIVGYVIPIVGKSYWSSLTADEQALFTATWNEVVPEQRAGILDNEAAGMATLQGQGVSFAEATAEQVTAARARMLERQQALVDSLAIPADVMELAEAAVK